MAKIFHRYRTPVDLEPFGLTDKQAADMLGISRSHFRNLYRQGLVPKPRRFGRSVRWLRDDLLRWIYGEKGGVK